MGTAKKLKSNLRYWSKKGSEWLYSHGIFSGGQLHFPDFLGIGAQRSGTTWLDRNLRCHPEVYMPSHKELHFFDRDFHKGLPHYSGLFKAGGQKIKGEITPAYASLPLERIQFIHKVMPNVRLIFIMRHPIDRAWSQARKSLIRDVSRKFEEVSEEEFYARFNSEESVERGNYLSNLNTWLSVFPREQLYIGFFDDVSERPKQLLSEIFTHIGVSADVNWESFRYNEAINTSPDIPIPQKYQNFLEDMYCRDIEALYERFGEPIARWRCSARVDSLASSQQLAGEVRD